MAITVRINKNKPWELFYNSFQRHPMKGYWVCPDLSTHCVYSSMIVKTMVLVKDVGFVVLIIFLTCYSLGGIIIPTRWVETTNQPDVGLSCCVLLLCVFGMSQSCLSFEKSSKAISGTDLLEVPIPYMFGLFFRPKFQWISSQFIWPNIYN